MGLHKCNCQWRLLFLSVLKLGSNLAKITRDLYCTSICFCWIVCLLRSLTHNYKTNVMGTLNMLGLAKRIGARFLLTSTSEVYGDPLEHPQKETYWGHVNPIGGRHLSFIWYVVLLCYLVWSLLLSSFQYSGVRSCYDEGKRTAETLTMDYHRGAGVEVIHVHCSDSCWNLSLVYWWFGSQKEYNVINLFCFTYFNNT